MKATNLIKAIVTDSGRTPYAISLAMGKSQSYLAQKIYAASPPNIGTLVAICRVTGHEVVIRNRSTGKEVIVDET